MRGRHAAHVRSGILGLTLVAATLLAPSSPAIPEVAAANPTITLLPVVTSGLDRPVFVTNAGDARLFVLEQPGRIRIVSGNNLFSTPFLDIRGSVSCCGERGLLGLAFHPDYSTNRRFFVYFTRNGGDIQITEFRRSASDPNRADPAPVRNILTVEHSLNTNHNGGMIAFGPDGYLYVGTGDGGGGGDEPGNAQNLGTRLGKLLRINVDATPIASAPADNPYVGGPGDDLIWSYGLRNPWRFSFDRATDDLWIGDVGQGRYEEIDRALASGGGGKAVNWGWNVLEGNHCYPSGDSCNRSGKTGPFTEYNHSYGCSVTGGYVYRGSASSVLGGRYLYGDYCSGRIWDVAAAGSAAPRQLLDTSLNISSFGEDAAGELYVVDHGGAVYRIDAGTGEVTRRAGADRYATAAAISAASFAPGVPVAFIATGQSYPDALAGGPAAAKEGGPLLLVRATAIPSATAAELTRLKPGRIVVLGGTGVVSAAVATALDAYTTGPVTRRAGADRYATAAAISAASFAPGVPVAFIATGQSYPDALAGGPAAAKEGGPLLLVRATAIPSATAAELTRLKPGRIVVLGGTGVVSAAVATALDAYTTGPVTRRAGADRYATAAAISAASFAPGVPVAFIATGDGFADALAGGPAAAKEGGPLLLVRSSIPFSTAAELQRLGPGRIVVLGGTGVISANVAIALGAYTED